MLQLDDQPPPSDRSRARVKFDRIKSWRNRVLFAPVMCLAVAGLSRIVPDPGHLVKIAKSAGISLAIVLAASAASAAESVWPADSASEMSTFVALQRFRIQADHCSAKVPNLKPRFDSLMENLTSRMQGISKGLVASEAFRGMKDKPVPSDIIFSFKDLLDDATHNFERLDAASVCPKALQNLAEMDDESLKAGLAQILASVQNMIRNLEKAVVR